jgi:hypothetical protein
VLKLRENTMQEWWPWLRNGGNEMKRGDWLRRKDMHSIKIDLDIDLTVWSTTANGAILSLQTKMAPGGKGQ